MGTPIRLSAALCVFLCACHSQPARSSVPSIRGEATVPLETIEFSGHRYVARADVGTQHGVPLMIHGNARMFLMVTHAVGEKITGGPVPKVAEYGYSSRGKGIIRVSELRLGGKRFENLSDVPVFDYTEDGDTPAQGMVGVPFLVGARAAVDFSRDVLILGVPSEGLNPKLVKEGYKHVLIAVTPDNRVTIMSFFPLIRRTLRITPSTVSNALTLHRPLFAYKVPMEKSASPDQSPSRTSPDLYTAEHVEFQLGGVRFYSPATFEDFAEYGKISENELESYGMLGFDWMKAHQAILDYSNRYLYFLP